MATEIPALDVHRSRGGRGHPHGGHGRPRHARGRVALIAFAIVAGAAAAVLAQNFDPVEVTSEKLADGVWMLKGSGGNLGVFAGPDGVVMIDDQHAPLTPRIQAAVKALSNQPIRTIINTHWHGDHTGGNENFAKLGAEIIAHESVRRRMSETHIYPAFKDTVPPSPAKALPVVTFEEGLMLHLNGDDLSVIHVPPAHTDGDALVWFHAANVIHTGDLCFNGMYPFIDTSSGGSIDGMISADDRLLALANERTRIVPGHGPLTDRAGLKRFRDMLAEVRDRVAKQVRGGKTADQLIASHVTADLDSTWGKGFLKPETFLRMVYQDLSSRAVTRQ